MPSPEAYEEKEVSEGVVIFDPRKCLKNSISQNCTHS